MKTTHKDADSNYYCSTANENQKGISVTGVRSCDFLVIFVMGSDICPLQPRKFDNLKI